MFTSQFRRLVAPALTIGGLLWITQYVIIVMIGMTTGKLAPPLNAH
jgi:hypothetical protein